MRWKKALCLLFEKTRPKFLLVLQDLAPAWPQDRFGELERNFRGLPKKTKICGFHLLSCGTLGREENGQSKVHKWKARLKSKIINIRTYQPPSPNLACADSCSTQLRSWNYSAKLGYEFKLLNFTWISSTLFNNYLFQIVCSSIITGEILKSIMPG